MSEALREYKVVFPAVHAGRVMGRLTVLDIEIKNAAVDNEICTVVVGLNESQAREFKEWLRSNTDGGGTVTSDKPPDPRV